MAAIALIAVAAATLRAESPLILAIASSVTAIAILTAILGSRELAGWPRSFLFGFWIFGAAYFVAMPSMHWDNRFPPVSDRVQELIATNGLVDTLAGILMKPRLPDLDFTPANEGEFLAYRRGLAVKTGLVHLAFCWLFGLVGGCVGLSFAAIRRRGASSASAGA